MGDYGDYNESYEMPESNKQQDLAEQEVSQRLPIKNHLDKIDFMLESLLKELEDSKKELQNLRNDVVSLGHINNEQGSELSRYVMDETLRLAKDFKKLTVIETDESQLTQDRIRLQQNTLTLESRVNETEKDLGFKHMYDA